jgi:hypothetical protein
MTAVAGLCCLPIVVWNAQHNWVTVRHVLVLAGLVRGPEPRPGLHIHWLGPLVYLAGQCALLLISWFVVWAAAMVAHRPWKESDAGVRYLWWLSAPMFALFLVFGFKTGGGELNWPVTAYLSGLVLTAPWLSAQLDSPVTWYRRCTQANLAVACVVGLLATLFLHYSDPLHPLLARLAGPPTRGDPFPLRKLDPTCRLRGFRALGAEVDRVRVELRQAGVEPVLAGCNWSTPGELGFYCAGNPTAYSIGLALGDRHSQYDLWHNPLAHRDDFRGKTFVIVGGVTPALCEAFDSVEPTRTIIYKENGQPIAAWMLTVCRGYRGFPHFKAGEDF